MKRGIIVLFSFLFCQTALAQPQNALTDYAFAQKCYHELDKTASRGWDRCIKQFEKIVELYPQSDEAPKALFSVGRLSQEKCSVTSDNADLQKAFDTYNLFLKTYPKHPMADDSLFLIAVLRFEKQGDKAKAEKALRALLERYPDGDRTKSADAYLKKVTIDMRPETVDRGPGTKMEEPDLSVRTVVIDPGHGGEDPGAIGKNGTREADVALQIARKLAFKLRNDLKLKVYLTRTNSKTVSLEERNAFANKKRADLFISIHANANDSPKAFGVQTFYLNNASSQAAGRLAARENRVSKRPLKVSDKILSTMLQNANTEESRDLARSVQKSMVHRLSRLYTPVKDLNVDSALFYVLVGAKSPSILVETSFITNPREEKRLKDSKYQWEVAESLAKGVRGYIESRGRLASSL